MTFVLAFLVSGAVVVIAGAALARSADAIAEATKLGRLWVGSVLLAGATSLPELSTDVAAVRLGAVDLAVGDLFGSSMANMLILAGIDLLPPRRHVLRSAAFDHALAACLAISLNALAAVFVLAGNAAVAFGTSLGSVVLLVAYLAGTRAVFRHTRSRPEATDTGATPASPSLRQAGIRFGLAALVILAAAPVFAWSAQGIAEISGLGATFVGTWLVGLATSLPELVASLAAIRLGAFDLAVGNLFGSNAFNMVLFFALDLAHPGPLFAALDPDHVLSGLFAVVLMSIGLAAIVFRAERRFGRLEPDSALMLATYCAALWVIYRHSVP